MRCDAARGQISVCIRDAQRTGVSGDDPPRSKKIAKIFPTDSIHILKRTPANVRYTRPHQTSPPFSPPSKDCHSITLASCIHFNPLTHGNNGFGHSVLTDDCSCQGRRVMGSPRQGLPRSLHQDGKDHASRVGALAWVRCGNLQSALTVFGLPLMLQN